jgi:hypothetical protein
MVGALSRPASIIGTDKVKKVFVHRYLVFSEPPADPKKKVQLLTIDVSERKSFFREFHRRYPTKRMITHLYLGAQAIEEKDDADA